jgi:hypothetical protein
MTKIGSLITKIVILKFYNVPKMCQNRNQNKENTENPVKYGMRSTRRIYCNVRWSAVLVKLF